ncbi:hypothetical protein IKE87_02365 [Candidatus Saccharibacteria bacterium]|nr:hypothetical protein [Candidatus Saccharibacteria bacterium]
MKKILKALLPTILCVIVMLGLMVAPALTQNAAAMTLQEGAEAARCDECPSELFGDNGVFKQVTNVILYIVGIIAVIMLIIGGIKYVISGGDAKKVTDAKNTVLYAIIGLVIAFLAFAIVNFVISTLPTASSQNKSASLITTMLHIG